MALIVENGTGLANAESYASVAELQAYYAARGGMPAGLADTQASATLVMTTQPTNDDTVTIDSRVYTFKSSLTGAADEVKIGATLADTKAALVAAVNNADGEGALYGVGTDKHDYVTAYADLTFKVNTAGSAGNAKTVGDNLTKVGDGFTTATFTGGSDVLEARLRTGTEYLDLVYESRLAGSKSYPYTQALAWPRVGVTDADGLLLDSNAIPLRLKRALYAICAENPATWLATVDGGTIKSETKQLGSLRKSVEYVGGKPTLPRFTRVLKEMAPLLDSDGSNSVARS